MMAWVGSRMSISVIFFIPGLIVVTLRVVKGVLTTTVPVASVVGEGVTVFNSVVSA